ncbi:MAG: peptidoglycan-binding protein [bacterium]|nr:peptidoglycan-binding protein [bacterium]
MLVFEHLSKRLIELFGLLLIVFLVTKFVSASGFQFNKNLNFGLRSDPEVIKLQDFLRNLGFFNLPTSSGNYFNVTVDAVKKFQLANNIKPISGYFGPLTRTQANRLSGTLTTNFPSPTPITPVPISVNRSATSTFFGQIEITDTNNSDNIKDEYTTIQNTGTTSISITGFKLTNSRGEEFQIPKGHNLPGISAVPPDEIILRGNDSAKIFIGKQDRHLDFRENLCTGYLDQDKSFGGKISRNCPEPDINTNLKLPDHCILVFEATGSCQTVDQSRIQIAECLEFSEAHYNYQGCIKDFKNKSNFFSRRWIIWMQRSSKFLRDIHDKVTLYDKDGKIVHVFTY